MSLPCSLPVSLPPSLRVPPPSVSTLDYPLPLEATPLPSSVLSPKLAIALENGVAVSVEKQPEQPAKMVGEEEHKPAGSPLPILNVLRTPFEVVSARASELLDIHQLLQGPLQSVLTEKSASAAADTTRFAVCMLCVHPGDFACLACVWSCLCLLSVCLCVLYELAWCVVC